MGQIIEYKVVRKSSLEKFTNEVFKILNSKNEKDKTKWELQGGVSQVINKQGLAIYCQAMILIKKEKKEVF